MDFCTYCGEELVMEDDHGLTAWVDATGGDCCSGNDELENEGHPHIVEDEPT